MVVDLKIPEARLDEFEAWFDANNPPPAKRDTLTFSPTKSGDVVYTVRVSVRAQSAADRLAEQWAKA